MERLLTAVPAVPGVLVGLCEELLLRAVEVAAPAPLHRPILPGPEVAEAQVLATVMEVMAVLAEEVVMPLQALMAEAEAEAEALAELAELADTTVLQVTKV